MAKNTNKDMFAYERERRDFIDGLRHFHNNRGTPFDQVPRLERKEIDLYSLYQKVTSLGGWKKVTEDQRWEDIFDEFKLPKACLNGDQALKHIYIRYLHIYEQIHFLGEDPKTVASRHDDDGPIRKKLCGPQYSVPLSYNYTQHEIAENLRPGHGLSTVYAKFSDYDKLEKALLSGLPNEVDFVINVCTLLSNESKHTLRLDKCIILTDLLLAHIGIFNKGIGSLEKLYENGWRNCSNRDFIRFWFDTVSNEDARQLISESRVDCKKNMVGKEVLQLGRNLGVDDKEGIRITQVAIILRNLSFDDHNMKFLANNDLVFRFLLLCVHCNYGTLHQLALDTLGNLAAHFVLDPVDSFKSKTILNLLVQCITSTDKFSVVRGLEMVSKLSRLEDNEFVLSEKLDTFIYEEIAKYLTIQDIQLIVSSLEALYQLSEIGEETNSKIAEVSNTVDTLVGLITVEAQSYGPNSLVGIKVVEYCPSPHLTGGVSDGPPGAVGPPGQAQPPGQPVQAGQQNAKKSTSVPGQAVPANKAPEPPKAASPMETTTCNWLQATYETCGGQLVSHIGLYTDYLHFCKRFQLTQVLSSHDFNNLIKLVFPRVGSVINAKEDGGKEMCIQGIQKRYKQLPFSISCPVERPRISVASTTPSVVRPHTSAIHSPTLLQRLAAPPPRSITPNPHPIYPAGVPVQQVGQTTPLQQISSSSHRVTAHTATIPTYALSGGIAAQGYVTDPQPPPLCAPNTQLSSKSKATPKRKGNKKNTLILPRPDQTTPKQPSIVPKVTQQPVVQNVQPVVQNVQYATYPQEIVYQTVDPQNAEAKVMVKTLLAKKIRQGNVIIQQPMQGVMNVDLAAAGDGQTLQYQTSYAQNVQQTTYIQYTAPASNAQAGVQTLYQPNQTQTFVVQSGDVYVQNQLPTSSLNPQIVAQQPLMVAQQQQMISGPQAVPQQQIISQSQVMPQSQIFTQSQGVPQSHVLQPQQILQQSPVIPQVQVIPQSQIISQPQVQIASQMAYSSSSLSSTSSLVSTSMSSVSSLTSSIPSSKSMSQSVLESASQSETHSSGSACPQENILCEADSTTNSNSQNDIDFEVCGEVERGHKIVNKGHAALIQKVENKNKSIDEPSSLENDVSENEMETSKLDLSSTEAVAEIESAVGSIMEGADENMDSQEEPVMIENDGNELMFETKYTAVNENENNSNSYVEDEAANAVEGLEQMQKSEENEDMESEQINVLKMNDNGEMKENEIVNNVHIGGIGNNLNGDLVMNIENDQNLNDQISDEQNEMNERNNAVDEDKLEPDQEIIAKFRAETPIIVPIVSENGLFEQDFEARMAVENLLKDVEFNVNGDDASSEENVNVFSCQHQENPGSVQTVSSLGESELPVCEDSRDSVTSESQTSTKTTIVNHNGVSSSVTSKSLTNSTHVPHNGISSEHKPLTNGNISSPEYQSSVPSPCGLNGPHPTKLVNGISEAKEKSLVSKTIDKVTKMNGVVNHVNKLNQKVLEISSNNVQVSESDTKMEIGSLDSKVDKTQDILAQSMMDSNIDKTPEDMLEQSIIDTKEDVKSENAGDILARSIFENGIQPSDCDIPDPEPTSVTAVVKQIIPNTMYGNIMTVQINNSTIPITFTNNAIITSKNSLTNPMNVCNSRHLPTPEPSRDGDLSCDSTTSSDLNIVISDKHSSVVSQSKISHKDSIKSLTSPKGGDSSKKSKAKKRSRSKSGGSGGNADSRPSSVTSPASASTPTPLPEFMCEWSQCRRCFDNAKSVFCHVCSVHLKTEFDGLCKWDGCETLVRKRWSLFTHVQDHHCSDNSLRVAAQRRLQSFQTGQKIAAPTVPAMVYPNDAASQAIKRFLPKAPYQEFTEGREGPVTKHIRLTSALILRNLAKYSPAGRSLIKKHERVISYVCMSAVESSTALANCLFEILQDH